MKRKIKKPEQILPEPSQEFIDAITSTGSISVDYQLCKRTHFLNDENEGNWKKGLLKIY